MKIRNGFVSNSSSSSFVCDVCGRDASGWDLGLEEAYMCQCVNGHTFCDTCGIFDEDEYESLDSVYEVSASKCRCCNFKDMSDKDLIRYLLVQNKTTKEGVAEVCRAKFKDYNEFMKYIYP